MRNLHFVWVLLCLFASAHAVRADVIVEGTVRYWDGTTDRLVPARHVTVEVERDWALDDPEVLTDDQGYFRIALPDPSWGTHDGVDLLVYAETPGLAQVYTSMWDFYPYEVTSTSYDDVPAGSTLRIDLDFGKPLGAPGTEQNRNVSSGSRFSSINAAKAFVVHEEMYEYYRQLLDHSWPANVFDEQVVIVPAFGVTSYYDHFTNNINLVTADWTGFGDWPPLPGQDDRFIEFNTFKYMVRHEYSHAIHDGITAIAPAGLNMPSEHSPYMESNIHIAWTEGFADFLALVTLDQKQHKWERSQEAADGLPVLTGNHFHMEGEVTGFLWDLYDPMGYEPLRHPATMSSDGNWILPPDLVDAQMFYDGLQDKTAAKIRQVASAPALWGFETLTGSMETLPSFIRHYAAAFPAPHELKAIALNRDLPLPAPVDHPARLRKDNSIRRWAGTITLSGFVEEDDPEDRPFVRLTMYQQLADGTVKPLAGLTNLKLTSGWNGNTCPVTAKATLEPGFHPGNALWLEVNDDVLPSVYRFTVPSKDDGVVTAAVADERPGGAHTSLPPSGIALVDGPKLENQATAPVTGATAVTARERENFDGPLDERWTLQGTARIERSTRDRALLADGFGLGVWDALGLEVTSVRFNYRHGEGVGDILLSMTDTARRPSAYHLLAFDDRIALVREALGGEVELASAPLVLVPGTWHEVYVSHHRHAFRVTIDRQDVLHATDPAPLPTGNLAFGALVGTGFAFDDLVVFSAVDPGAPAAPASPAVRPPSRAPALAAEATRGQELRALVQAARKELRAYGDLLRRRERTDRALYRLAHDHGSLSATVDPDRVFPRRRAAAPPAVVTLAPAERVARDAYVRWTDETAKGLALAKPLDAAQKQMLVKYRGDLKTRTDAHGAAKARAADLRRQLQAMVATVKREDSEAQAQTQHAVAGLVQALEQIETDTDLVPTLVKQQAVLGTLGR